MNDLQNLFFPILAADRRNRANAFDEYGLDVANGLNIDDADADMGEQNPNLNLNPNPNLNLDEDVVMAGPQEEEKEDEDVNMEGDEIDGDPMNGM